MIHKLVAALSTRGRNSWFLEGLPKHGQTGCRHWSRRKRCLYSISQLFVLQPRGFRGHGSSFLLLVLPDATFPTRTGQRAICFSDAFTSTSCLLLLRLSHRWIPFDQARLPTTVSQILATFPLFERLPLSDRASMAGLLVATLDMLSCADSTDPHDQVTT